MEEFTPSTGWKAFHGAIAAVMIGLSLFLFTTNHPKAGNAVFIIPIVIFLFAALIIISQIKRKIIVSADKIISITIFGRKELLTADVKGCRIAGKNISIEPISPANAKIVISNYSYLGNSEDLVSWFRGNFIDLDSADFEEEQSKLMHDTNLGFTEEERGQKIEKAKQIAKVFNISAMVISFPMLVFNYKPGIVLLLLYPFIGIVIIKLNNGLIRFISNQKRSVFPFVVVGFLVPAFILFTKSMNGYDIFKYDHVWLIAISISVVIFLSLYFSGSNLAVEAVKGEVFFMIAVACLFGYGSTIQVNCVFDQSKPQQFQATVLNQRYTTGKPILII